MSFAGNNFLVRYIVKPQLAHKIEKFIPLETQIFLDPVTSFYNNIINGSEGAKLTPKL